MFILFIRLLSSVHTGSVQGEARVFSLVIVDVAGNQMCFAMDTDATTLRDNRNVAHAWSDCSILHLFRSRLFTFSFHVVSSKADPPVMISPISSAVTPDET